VKRLVLVAGLAACSDPVVEMHLVVPPDIASIDTSCMQGIVFYVDGGRYPADLNDYQGSCVNVTAPPTMADLPTALRGKVDMQIPPDGLHAVEIYGLNVACGASGSPSSADLIFQGAEPYTGDSELTITAVPNAACTSHSISVKPVDMLKLIASPTHDCAAATLPDGPSTTVYFGTYFPYLTTPSAAFYGDVEGASQQNGVVTATGLDSIGPDACLAFDGYDGSDLSSTSCALDTPPVCAAAGQHELAVVSYTVINSSIDQSLVNKYGGYVVGSVWAKSGATKAPVANATVTIDGATQGEIHYMTPMGDLSSTTGRLVEGGSATGTSGLFVLYTGDITALTISANDQQQHVRVMGSKSLSYGAAMIMMP
jgi:hypothetical protein